MKSLNPIIKYFPIWKSLAINDIARRYRRSLLGPFWITISLFILVFCLALVYSNLLGETFYDYFLYLCLGLIYWNYISTLINDSNNIFIEVEGIIKQIKLPLVIFHFRIVFRNIIILSHHLLVLIIYFIFFGDIEFVNFLKGLAGLILFISASVPISIIVSLVATRYRDIPQIISSLLQISFFITPILFNEKILKNYYWLLDVNPFYYFLILFRSPFLNQNIESYIYYTAVIIILLLILLSLFLLRKFSSRVVYWL